MSPEELNLIPAHILTRAQVRRRLRRWALGVLALLVFFPLARAELGIRLKREEGRLSLLRACEQAWELRRVSCEDLEIEKERLGQELQALSSLSLAGSLLGVFRSLEGAMPPEVYLSSLSAEPASGVTSHPGAGPQAFILRLEGRAPSTDLVASFLLRLASRKDLADTRLLFSRREEGGERRGVSFGLEARFQPRGR